VGRLTFKERTLPFANWLIIPQTDKQDDPTARAACACDGNLERCSVCGYPLPADVKPSMSERSPNILFGVHKPGQSSEDVNQALRRSSEKQLMANEAQRIPQPEVLCD
jgi:hypothetical protein